MSRKALVVGINKYKHLNPDLPSASTDAQDMLDLLVRYGDFDVNPLPVMKGDAEFSYKIYPDGEVYRDDLKTKIYELFCVGKKQYNDTALLFFSGHGTLDEIPPQKGYLAAYDSAKESDGVAISWLIDTLKDSPVPNKIVFLDCCFSGNIRDFNINISGDNNSICIIAASGTSEKAFVGNSGKHGVLTDVLIEGLTPKDKEITCTSLIEFVQNKIRGAIQTPVCIVAGQRVVITTPMSYSKIHKTKVPPLLPFLPDRDNHEKNLVEMIENVRMMDKPHPIVCYIHGDENQCHNDFLNRIKEFYLGKHFEEPFKELSTTINCPTSFKDIDEFSYYLRRNLSASVFDGIQNKSLEEINAEFSGFKNVLLQTLVCTDDWEKYDKTKYKEILENYKSFWNSWPPMESHQFILVFFCFIYQKREKKNFFDIFKKRNPEKKNSLILSVFENLHLSNTDKCSSLVLPRLDGITEGDAIRWAKRDDVKKLSRVACPDRTIRRIYEESKTKHIPMELLADSILQNIFLIKFT